MYLILKGTIKKGTRLSGNAFLWYSVKCKAKCYERFNHRNTLSTRTLE